VIRRGLAVEPDARWPTMDALLAALADDPLARARRRRRVLAWFVLAAFVVAGATYGVSLLREAVERSRREAAAATRLAAVEETIARAEAEGDQASAEAAFRAFITDPEHRRTRAHARAWLDRGDRRTAVPAAARAAYAEAYVNATAVDDERDALQRLADTFVRDWNGVGLGRTAELLRDRGADDLALADLTVQAALWRGDLPTATTALARAGQQLVDWQPALQHLARATTSPTTVGDIELLSGDGPARFAVRDAAGTHVLLLDRALDEVGRWHDEGRIDLVPGTSWVLAQTATEARVVDLRTGAVLGRGAPDIATLAPFDATGDGVPELFFGRVWPRYGFERWDGLGRGETSVRGAHPGTDAGNSVVEAHAVGDLDGDGRDELALGFGPWRRFDLRVFRPDARGELELVAERRLGRIGGLALVHREGRPMLAVLVDNSSPAPEVFPEPPHTGGPPGLHLFEWANGTLVEADFIALPRSDDFGRFTAHDREAVGDLDGDGREDLAFPLDRAGQPWLLLLRQTATSFEPLLVAGIELFAGAQLDDDAPIELLAALPPERRLLALGLGDAPPLTSRHDEPELPAVPPPLLADPWLVERWQRANDLTALALFDSAAESLRDAALMTADRPARSALLDRAGALFAGQDRMADVLALADDVHDDWQVRSRVQLRRTQALSRLGRHADALASAEALLRAPERDAESARHAAALADELSALLDPATQIDLRFDVPLAPGWRIHTPGALSRKRTRGVLELAIPALDTAVAELPIDWRGGPISLEFELDVDRIEFGAGIEISLVDADGARWLGAALSGQGGGGRLRQVMWVRAGGTSWVELSGHAVASGLHRRRLAVRLTYFPAAAAANLMLANDDDVRLARLAVAAPPSPGLHRLRIGAFADSKMSSLATGELRRLVIRGAALGVAGDDASDRAARLLAEHEPRAALATLDQDASSDPRADMLRLLALADLADLAGLADAIPAVLAHADDPTHRGELVLALRRHPLAGAALRDAAGPALLPALWATWAFARPHRNDLLQRDELLDGLREIDRLAPRTDAERDALRELLETRARLWERAELPERARQDRELAAALARGMSTSTHSPGVLTTSSSRD
jgi:hypothetical protein